MNPSILMFGGKSEERFVSVASAQNLASIFEFSEVWFISPLGQIFLVDSNELASHKDPFKLPFVPAKAPIAQSLEQAIPKLKNRTVFMGFHGTEGEDGKIQALLEKNRVAFTGSGSESSQICFDKPTAKKVLSKHDISVAPEIILSSGDPDKAESELREFFISNRKIVAKPTANGSSIGLHIISDQNSLKSAIDDIRKSRAGAFMAEKFISGREITVGVIEKNGDLEALPPSEVLLNEGHSFDYDGKYLGKGTREITPAELNANDLMSIQTLAIRAHRLLNCFGYTRTDVILSSEGITYLETNTLPGLTKASFIPQQLNVANIPFKSFIKDQIELAEQRY